MRRKDRALALLLAIGMTLCLLSACGQGGPAPSQTSAADASTAELSAQPTEAAAEPEQETASLPESSAEAEGSGEVPLEPPEDAEASPLTGSTVKGIDYPIGDPDDPTELTNSWTPGTPCPGWRIFRRPPAAGSASMKSARPAPRSSST